MYTNVYADIANTMVNMSYYKSWTCFLSVPVTGDFLWTLSWRQSMFNQGTSSKGSKYTTLAFACI